MSDDMIELELDLDRPPVKAAGAYSRPNPYPVTPIPAAISWDVGSDPGYLVNPNPRDVGAATRVILPDAGPMAAVAMALAIHYGSVLAGRLADTLASERAALAAYNLRVAQEAANARAQAARLASLAESEAQSLPQRLTEIQTGGLLPSSGYPYAATRQTLATPIPRAGSVTRGDVVAGARSEASYIMLAWSGAGEINRASVVNHCDAFNARQYYGIGKIEPMASRSAHAHIGKAVDLLRYQGYKVSAERGKARKDRSLKAAWIVGKGNQQGDVGDAFGTLVMRVTLSANDAVSYDYVDGYQGLADEVAAEYRRTAGDELYPPGDVTLWANQVMRGHFRAVRMGQVWIVPSDKAQAAEAFCTGLAETVGFGRDWMLPAIPVSTTDQLMRGMARGLIEEAKAVLGDLDQQRKVARSQGRTEIGPRAATGLLGRLQVVRERTDAYARALGDELVADVRTEIDGAINVIKPLLDDTSQRGAMLELS